NFTARHPDQAHAYELEDIDNFSSHLGIPWQQAKDVPFTEVFDFIGMRWDIPNKTVTLTESKVIKYRAAISDWLATCTHMISELQKLYGKLMHVTNAIPQGCAYLTGLKFMLPWFLHDPHKPRKAPRSVNIDLQWWLGRLTLPPLPRPIPAPVEIHNIQAYSDASSSTGIGIIIGQQW
ncbi:hypothetical protein AX17_006105, partial [Amanita inopinata Kibby_2008]